MPPRGAWPRIVGTALASLAILVAGVLIGTLRLSSPPAEQSAVVRASPSIIVAVRDLARLEGASMHVERVIDLKSQQSRFFGLVAAEDALLLVAAGDVSAGVDLSRVRPEDIDVDHAARSVVIRLPAASVSPPRIDNDRTYVHTRKTDLLARRQETLETQARQEAERSLLEAALGSGLRQRAERNVAKTLEGLGLALGYREVDVVFQERPAE